AEAFARWQQARAAGESVVVCASDHATVTDLAARCRAARVETGEVEPGGVPARGQMVIGVGDEIVTTRNDRRLTTTGHQWVRNGDRWRIDARYPDGSLTVCDLGGRGRLTLPGDYVSDNVTLAYAVTVHKAQGLTVDRAVLIADETTTAEALYVAMTRGRHSNTALVITDPDNLDHHSPVEARTAREVLTGALQRVSGERSATEELRQALAASESLAVLKPRLASVDTQIARECPPDRTTDLQRLAEHRSRLERHARPGRLTRAGRDDRRQLLGLDERHHELQAAQHHRHDWLETHADTLAYRDHLAGQVTARRTALGAAATNTARAISWSSSAPFPPTTPTAPGGRNSPAGSRPTERNGASSPSDCANRPPTAPSTATGRQPSRQLT
ncbi:MAG: ATP-binding domain-containing protein, partial [Acidimicrobiia bacterium]|nr:ATP-binding domain-containing protein [Acidimicrobiia bacterium]